MMCRFPQLWVGQWFSLVPEGAKDYDKSWAGPWRKCGRNAYHRPCGDDPEVKEIPDWEVKWYRVYPIRSRDNGTVYVLPGDMPGNPGFNDHRRVRDPSNRGG